MSGNTSRFDEDLVDASALKDQLARSRTVPEFTMQMVSNESHVPADTIRSWERRYGFPQPQRTDANYRLYSRRDIVAIIWVREQTERGRGVREAIASLTSILDEADATPSPATPAPLAPVKTLTAALLDDDPIAARAAWDQLALALSVEGLCKDVLLPTYQRLAAEGLSIGARSRAEAFLLRKAIVLFDASAPEQGLRDVAINYYSDHAATLPATVLGTLLSRNGFRIAHPIADLARSETMISLTAEPASTMIVVTPRVDANLEALLTGLDSNSVRFWWPEHDARRTDDRWLPTDPTEVAGSLS